MGSSSSSSSEGFGRVRTLCTHHRRVHLPPSKCMCGCVGVFALLDTRVCWRVCVFMCVCVCCVQAPRLRRPFGGVPSPCFWWRVLEGDIWWVCVRVSVRAGGGGDGVHSRVRHMTSRPPTRTLEGVAGGRTTAYSVHVRSAAAVVKFSNVLDVCESCHACSADVRPSDGLSSTNA